VGLQLGGGYCRAWVGLGRGPKPAGRQAISRVVGVPGTRWLDWNGKFRSIWGTVLCLIGYEVTIIMNKSIVGERDCVHRSRILVDSLDTDSSIEVRVEVLDG
jgi:hypothetical protein